MEKQRFEEAFSEAFEGSEIYPSDSVWSNIEQDLDKRSGKKGLLLLIQLLAAASMVFAMGIGGVYYVSGPQEYAPTASVIKNEPLIKPIEKKLVTPSVPKTPDQKEINALDNSMHLQTNASVAFVSTPMAGTILSENTTSKTTLRQFDVDKLPPLVVLEQPKLIFPDKPQPDPGMVLLARLRDEERKYQQVSKQKSRERVWTSVGVGAGSFNPYVAQTSALPDGVRSFGGPAGSVPAAKADPIPAPSNATSYSVGINLATKISNRFVLQGGLSYLSQNADYTSTTADMGKAALNEHGVNAEDPSTTKAYKVRNNLQFMSVPVQAGYIILDQDFAIQLNGGLSTDIFIQNTLTPSNNLEKVTTRSGSDSPYRPVNFSGLIGTELSYKLGNHYRVAVNPGLRYALNSIYKSEVPGVVAPITYDVSLRFRYIFK